MIATTEDTHTSTNLYSTRTPDLTGPDEITVRNNLRQYFLAVYEGYEKLFNCMADEKAYYEKAISLRHPLIFYLGHTATFFINKMLLTRLVDSRLDEKMEATFAVGVDEMSWDDLDDTHYDWPSVKAVMEYRDKVKKIVLDIIDNGELALPVNWNHPWWAIIMGIEHEQIHLETSSVLMRQQNLEWIKPNPDFAPCKESGNAPENELLPVSDGKIVLGKDWDSPIYGWDNEYGYHEAQVKDFEASKYLVSNSEFFQFMEDGGYKNKEYWSEEGWGWRSFEDRKAPEFWVKKENGWYLRLLAEQVQMPWNWPVDVNYHEAKAFCNWKAKQTGKPVRLPTEDEWYRLYEVADLQPPTKGEKWNANIHLDHFASSCPVDKFQHGDFYDVMGNVWQWTQTPTYPFEGFDVHPIYDDFTTPTFDGQHNTIKGGSWISCGNETQLSSRYAFRRHFFQHAGFRYVSSSAADTAPLSQYETDTLMSEYAEFHYGDTYFDVANFPKALVDLIMDYMKGRKTNSALDIGCASGRSSFELSKYFDKVTGVDFSARFINQGVQIGRDGQIRYTLCDEGDLVLYKTRTLKELGLDNVKVPEFIQGDACNLKPILTDYDLVFAANLIDRLYEPAKFLNEIRSRINQGGLLMISSPYTWLEEHTPKEHWIGGFKKNAESYTTLDGLKDYLEKDFKLIDKPRQVPFVLRETSHKFQHTLSEVTVWERI